MHDLRRWINLCEVATPAGDIFTQAAKRLIEHIDWSGGGGELVIAMMDHDPYDDDNPVDTKSPEFQEQLLNWAENRVYDAFWNIKGHFKGDIIRVYREITAAPDWKPDPNRHPGEFWSWDADSAEAHWGHTADGQVAWLMSADVHASQIEWVQTLAVNGLPDQEDEAEIYIPETQPIKLLGYKRVK